MELGPQGIRVNAVRRALQRRAAAAAFSFGLRATPGSRHARVHIAQVLPAATNTPMLRAGFANNQEGE